MARAETFDPVAFKDGIRREWAAAAPGWRKWFQTLEAEHASQPISRALVEQVRIGPGDHVLDVGAGYGEPGLTAARAVSPGGRVVLQDIAGDMLAFARERAEEAGLDVEFEILERDTEELDLERGSFDAIVSRATIMYFVDVVGTLRRLRSALKPGGRLAASVWGPPDRVGFAAPLPVILDALELPPPPKGRPGPFVLADPEQLASVVAEAGFEDVETAASTATFEVGSPEAATRLVRDLAPPITALVDDRPPDVQERVWQRVTKEAWRPFTGSDGRVRLPNEAHLVSATNPGTSRSGDPE